MAGKSLGVALTVTVICEYTETWAGSCQRLLTVVACYVTYESVVAGRESGRNSNLKNTVTSTTLNLPDHDETLAIVILTTIG